MSEGGACREMTAEEIVASEPWHVCHSGWKRIALALRVLEIVESKAARLADPKCPHIGDGAIEDFCREILCRAKEEKP